MMHEYCSKYHAIYNQVADEVIAELDDDEVEFIRRHPSGVYHHFGLALYIRNKYIHSGKIRYFGHADDASGEIMDAIIYKLLPEYHDYPLALELADINASFRAVHVHALANNALPELLSLVKGHYELLEKASEVKKGTRAEFDDDCKIANEKEWELACGSASQLRDEFVLAVADALWDFPSYGDAASRLGIDSGFVAAFEGICRRSLLNSYHDAVFIPSGVGLLPAFESLPNSGKNASLEQLENLFRSCVPDELVSSAPPALFASREAAAVALAQNGKILKSMPQWADDRELVGIAVEENPYAIEFASERLSQDRDILKRAMRGATHTLLFFKDIFTRYNDDDELVSAAIQANGGNIAYASERIRDDFDMALAAVSNKKDIYPDASYKELSDRLKADRRIARVVASWPNTVPHDFPHPSLRDDDEIGELLANAPGHIGHSALYNMSRRIKEKYMTEEELERWD